VRNRLLVGFILFAFIATALLVVPLGLTLQAHESSDTLTILRRDTSALSSLLTDALNHHDLQRAVELAESYSRATGRQILVADGNKFLVATRKSQEQDRTLMKIADSLRQKKLVGTTRGNVREGPQYYVAVLLRHVCSRVASGKRPVLILTSAVNVANARIRSNWTKLLLYGLLMLFLACLFGVIVSNSLVRPLRRIGLAVEEIGNGSLESRAPVTDGPRELRRLADSINSTASRLINLLEVQRGFVEDASHQLRTPLTALQLHLENLQRGEQMSSGEDLRAVLAEVGRLNRLVDSLLALARNESASADVTSVNVHDAVLERADVWRPLADELDLRLETSVGSADRGVAGEGVLEQVLDNLLSNAFDATPSGGRISIESRLNEDTVELHVIDNGPGLSASERALALQRFWRKRDNNSAGAGLGLAIVDQLVRLSGGSFELREAPEGGLDATVILRRNERSYAGLFSNLQ
jgi:signal transduction histidine kinase